MSQYQAISFVYNEQPSAAKWNIIGSNFDYMQGALPPVGAMMYYWGDSAAVPGYYLFANGQTVSDSESPINGLTIPDLRSKFVRSVTSGNVRTTPQTGGSDTKNLAHSHTANTGGYTLTIADIPSHNHQIVIPGTYFNVNFTGTGFNPIGVDNNGSPQGFFSTSQGGNGSHSHTIANDLSASQDVLNAYNGLVPIIRFK